MKLSADRPLVFWIAVGTQSGGRKLVEVSPRLDRKEAWEDAESMALNWIADPGVAEHIKRVWGPAAAEEADRIVRIGWRPNSRETVRDILSMSKRYDLGFNVFVSGPHGLHHTSHDAVLFDLTPRDLATMSGLTSTAPNHPHAERATVFYHGAPRKALASILKKGLEPSEGWGGAGTFGVYLAGTPEGALYWAKLAWQRAHDEKMEASRFDRKYGDRVGELLAVVEVRIPPEAIKNLKADMEQAEDVGFEGDASDWEASLKEIGDVMYDGSVPAAWVREVPIPR